MNLNQPASINRDMLLRSILLIIALSLSACGTPADTTSTTGTDSTATGQDDTNSDDKSNDDSDQSGAADGLSVIASNCLNCHGTNSPRAGLDLSIATVTENTHDVSSSQSDLAIVKPGDSANSYLIHKLENTHTSVGGSGSLMPQGGQLSAENIALVKAWIDAPSSNDGSGNGDGSGDGADDGSDSGSGGDSGSSITLSSLQTNIFTPKCSGCHTGSGGSLPGVMNLSSGSTYAATVSQSASTGSGLIRVKANDAAGSLLYRKVAGTQISGEGNQMPNGGPALSAQQISDIAGWINAGALDN